MNCPNLLCQKKIPTHIRHCPYCGAELIASWLRLWRQPLTRWGVVLMLFLIVAAQLIASYWLTEEETNALIIVTSEVSDTFTPTLVPTFIPTATNTPSATNTPMATSTPTSTQTPTPIDTPIPTNTTAAQVIFGLTESPVSLWSGPGYHTTRLREFAAEEKLIIIGRGNTTGWLKVMTTSGTEGWVAPHLLTLDIPYDALPVIAD